MTRLRFVRPAAWAISLPTSVEPVNATLSTSSCSASARAGVAVAGDDVQDAVGDARLERQLAEAQRAQRRLLGRLEDDRAAGGQRRADLPGGHQQREVPRDDLADDADRLLERVGVELGARHVGQRRRDGRAAQLRRPAGHVPEQVGGERDVGGGGDGLRLAVVERVELGELVEVLGDQVAEAVDRAAALGRRHLRPRARPARARAAWTARSTSSALPCATVRQHLAGAGVDGLEGLRRRRRRPTAPSISSWRGWDVKRRVASAIGTAIAMVVSSSF